MSAALSTAPASGFALGLRETAAILGASWEGARDLPLQGVSTDTRSLQGGELFVALRGPQFDGHDFLMQARAAGAAACLIEGDAPAALPAIRVADTRRALGQLAAAWRARFDLPLVGVTGSNGKTTVKEMLAAILGRDGPVLATRGNLNNDIGLPLTLFGLDRVHCAAVIEMGANHPGEIAALTGIARPTVGVVTNAGSAHLEGFGSLEGVAQAKGELFAGLPADAVAVINADDRFAALWHTQAAARRVLHFGLDAEAEVRGSWEPSADGGRLAMATPAGALDIRLALPGRHNALNALAAAAAALAAGASLDSIGAGLEDFRPVAGRLQWRTARNGARLLDDTYNANPDSLEAGLPVLTSAPGQHWLVLGDMGELGDGAVALHRRAGEMARAAGVERLFAIGDLAREAAAGFGDGARHFVDPQALVAALAAELDAGVTILVKGSRRMRMERVVEALLGGRV